MSRYLPFFSFDGSPYLLLTTTVFSKEETGKLFGVGANLKMNCNHRSDQIMSVTQ